MPNRELSHHQERMRDLKFAIFYLLVALAILLANEFAKNQSAARSGSDLSPNVELVVSVGQKTKSPQTGDNVAGGITYPVRFRLTNRGNQPIFYPVDRATSRPIGHIVYRPTGGSEWAPVSVQSATASNPAQPGPQGCAAWLEMPPGGWVDGAYEDSAEPESDHAYEFDLKIARSDQLTPLLSQAYRLSQD